MASHDRFPLSAGPAFLVQLEQGVPEVHGLVLDAGFARCLGVTSLAITRLFDRVGASGEKMDGKTLSER